MPSHKDLTATDLHRSVRFTQEAEPTALPGDQWLNPVTGMLSQRNEADDNWITITANDTDANLKSRANHTGTQSADTLTDGTTNKAFLATERTKLAGIATGATAVTTLDTLTDVAITSAALSQTIRRNAANTAWVNVPALSIDAVRDYGADNSGAGNTFTEVQAAITAAAAADLPLVFAPGSYRINDKLEWASGVHCWAYGATFLSYDTELGVDSIGNPVINFIGVADASIRGLKINGRKASFVGATEWKHGITINDSSNILLEDMEIWDTKGDGVYVGTDTPASLFNSHITLRRVYCHGNHRLGMAITEGEHINVYDSWFNANTGTSPMGGVDIEPDSDVSICRHIAYMNCEMRDNGPQTGDPEGSGVFVTLRAAGRATQGDIRFYGCVIDGNWQHGVTLYNAYDTVFENCVITNNEYHGVEFKFTAKNVQFLNCRVIATTTRHGYLIGNSGAFTIEHVVIRDGSILTNVASGSQDGIQFGTGGGLVITDVLIDNVDIEARRYAINASTAVVGLKLDNLSNISGLTAKTNALTRSNTIASSVAPIQFSGGGSEIADATYAEIVAPYNLVILGWDFLGTPSGSIVADVWVDTYANYPPADADSIAASDLPTITTAVKAQDLAPTGWTQHVAAGSVIRGSVDSCTTTTLATLYLHVARVG